MHRSNHGPGGACIPIWPMAKRPARTRRAASPRHPRREHTAATTAETAGPRPERSSRPQTRRAAHRRMCTAQMAPLKSRHPALTSAAQLRRVSAPYWPKIARRKTKNFFHWIKITFRFANGNFLMRTAVFLYNNVRVYSFSLCVCLDVSGGHA